LDRRLAERRYFPAVDITRSGTHREELIFDEETLKQIWLRRRMVSLISNDGNASATERVLERLANTANNKEFLANLNKEV